MSRTVIASRSGPTRFPGAKDPGDKLVYRVDWTHLLAPLGDTIATSTWDAGGLTASGDQLEAGATSATVWLEGGAPGRRYTVSNRITTAAGRVVERSFQLEVDER